MGDAEQGTDIALALGRADRFVVPALERNGEARRRTSREKE